MEVVLSSLLTETRLYHLITITQVKMEELYTDLVVQ